MITSFMPAPFPRKTPRRLFFSSFLMQYANPQRKRRHDTGKSPAHGQNRAVRLDKAKDHLKLSDESAGTQKEQGDEIITTRAAMRFFPVCPWVGKD
jgi:hypothetical protein